MTRAAETAAVTEAAPAKVNLALHVTGRRADGYHLIDSLVVFAPIGDVVSVRAADSLTLAVEGPFAAAAPAGEANIVMTAARAIGGGRGAAITLTKNLPVASGVGGGSADAAATLRALSRLWALPPPGADQALGLGADVPVCLAGRPSRMRGIGEVLGPLPGPCPVHMVLVNPGVALATAEVFAALAGRENPGLPDPPRFDTARDMATFAAGCRNDLQTPAEALAPAVTAALAAIRATEGCLLARMSGSGATCFGLYPDAAARDAARAALVDGHPGWWVAA
jgi:4-diphosphocytidyl-2-C-methyl-D-erythritol kinase